MAVPRVGMINPEAPSPTQPRIAQPTPGISTGQRTTLPSQTRSMNGQPPVVAPKTPATMLPIPTGKPATSVSAPGGMISQAPSGTRPLPPSATRGNQTPAAIQARTDARAMAAPAPAVAPAPDAAAAPVVAPTPSVSPAPTGGTGKKKPEPYVAPEGYDRLAGYGPDASPDQILFEKDQIAARQKARGKDLSDQEIELRFRERLERFQTTGEPSKNAAGEMAAPPAGTTEAVAPEAPPVLEPIAEQAKLFETMQTTFTTQIQQLQDQIKQLVDQISALQSPTQTQATAATPTGNAPATPPAPGNGMPAGMDQIRIAQFYQIAAPMMISGTFQQVVDAIVSAGLTPTDTELAFLESEIARIRAG